MSLLQEAAGTGRRQAVAGLLLWVVPLLVVCVMVAADPAKRSVTPVFHLASQRWWARGELYADVRGYHYLPQFALLFAPFHALPVPAGDILWRAMSVALVLGGIRAFLSRAGMADSGRAFLLSCALALAPCLGAVRNGQTNLAFGGLCLLLAVCLASARWTLAAACLVALVAIKPFGLVLVLLAPWGYRQLTRPLTVGLAALAALPFLFAPPSYAISQYRGAWAHLAGWSGTTESRFADLTALFRMAGVALSPGVSAAIRALGAVATLGLWLRASRLGTEPGRALTLVLLGTTYVILFNPMTEKNTYAIVAPGFAIAAVACLSSEPARRFGWLLAFALVSIGVFPELFHGLDRDFGLWWDPLVASLVGVALARWILGGRTPYPPGDGGGNIGDS